MFFRGLCLVAFAISMFVRVRQYNNPTHILSSVTPSAGPISDYQPGAKELGVNFTPEFEIYPHRS